MRRAAPSHPAQLCQVCARRSRGRARGATPPWGSAARGCRCRRRAGGRPAPAGWGAAPAEAAGRRLPGMADPLRRTLSKLRGRRSQRGAAAGAGHRHGGVCAPQGKCPGRLWVRLRGSGCPPAGGRPSTCRAGAPGRRRAAGSPLDEGVEEPRGRRGCAVAPAPESPGRGRRWVPGPGAAAGAALPGSAHFPPLRGSGFHVLTRRCPLQTVTLLLLPNRAEKAPRGRGMAL